jgi:hypothetical protein
MGSPLSPVIANFYMEDFEDRALDLAPHTPLFLFHYVDNSVAFLPYVGPIFNRISRALSQHNIKSVGLHPTKVSSFLRPIKDNLGLRTLGICRTPVSAARSTLGRQAVPWTPG